jgi:hypothetical protein
MLGGNNADYAYSVVTDPNKNIFVGGYTKSTVFEGLPITTTGLFDMFLTKVTDQDTYAEKVWTSRFGTSLSDYLMAIAIGPNSEIFIAGQTQGALPGNTNVGGTDAFIAQCSPIDGTPLWYLQFGSTGDDYLTSITVDNSGDIYVCGYASGSFHGQAHAGSFDAFITKFSPTGTSSPPTRQWTKLIGGDSMDFAKSIKVDKYKNIFVCGDTMSSSFSGQPGYGSQDAFIVKYDYDGTLKWVDRFGTSVLDKATSLTIDSNQNVILVGLQYGAGFVKKYIAPVLPCDFVLPGDWNDDCQVNLVDFAVIASSWLIDCHVPPLDPACTPK